MGAHRGVEDTLSAPVGRAETSAADVSVIVPTYNRGRYIQECLDSLLAQTSSAREIIVVDDGSDDDTAERVTAYGDRVRYMRKANGGKASAVNLGLSIARGAWVWILDDDDVAMPDAIETRMAALRAAPDANLVYGPHFIGTDGPDGRIVRLHVHVTPDFDQDSFFGELLNGCFFHLGTALVRRDLYERVGPFDGTLVSSEDYDMQIRLAREAKVAFSPTPVFVFRQHSGERGARLVRYKAAERQRVFMRFDKVIGRKIRSELQLGEYLIPRKLAVETNFERRVALTRRMLVMASKGCLDEMFGDLRAVLSLAESDGALSEGEVSAVRDLVCTGYAFPAAQGCWSRFRQESAELVKFRDGTQALRCIARGFLRVARSYPNSLRDRIWAAYAAAVVAYAGFIGVP